MKKEISILLAVAALTGTSLASAYAAGTDTVSQITDTATLREYIEDKVKGSQAYEGHPLYTLASDETMMKSFLDCEDLDEAMINAFPADEAIANGAWYTKEIAAPVFMGVIDGRGDGTFDGGASVKVAEAAKMIAATFDVVDTNDSDISNPTVFSGSEWAKAYYNQSAKAFPYTSSSLMSSSYMQSDMRRCEVAYVLAKYMDTTGELDEYINAARAKNFNSYDKNILTDFSDCNVISTDGTDGDYNSDQAVYNSGLVPARYMGALEYCYDKGVFTGNGDGTMGPVDTVTRGQLGALLTRVCQVTDSDAADRFKGETYVDPSAVYVDDVTTETVSGSSEIDPDDPYAYKNLPEYIEEQEWRAYMLKNPLPEGVGDGVLYNADWVKCDAYDSAELGINSSECLSSRVNITVRWDDPDRPRLKLGDTFIASDGTAYKLDESNSIKAPTTGEWILGVGLPIAVDLGRQSTSVTGTSSVVAEVVEGKTGSCFGEAGYEMNPTGKYIVFNGEGHWKSEWEAIKLYLMANGGLPTYTAENGTVSDDGLWRYNEVLGGWLFLPLVGQN